MKEVLENFIAQSDEVSTQKTKHYPNYYRNLRVKVSFGRGSFSSIPWIAFRGIGQEVSRGIYPVVLYYKKNKELILAYGVSEEKKQIKNGFLMVSHLKLSMNIILKNMVQNLINMGNLIFFTRKLYRHLLIWENYVIELKKS
ncbi:MrcB family domain-containing protein [Enterobacter ludwigii]|uniref:MrcB family domain-containing protein n=1 Tax=Enterobacter ludwigii TaxID=299767 RepID=UPI002B1CDF53|nr:DUF3578 domain-containing protein [Enterobacter ludwigii]